MAGVLGGGGGDVFGGEVHVVGECFGDVGEEGGFVAGFGGFGGEVAGDEEGGVGLDHDAVEGDFFDEVLEGSAAAFVADPACDADKKAAIQIRSERAGVARKAVDDGGGEAVGVGVEAVEEGGVCVAFVEKEGLSGGDGQVNLGFKPAQLDISGREVAVEVEAALTDGDDFGELEEGFDGLEGLFVAAGGVVGVDSGGGEEDVGVGRCQFLGAAAGVKGGPGEDHLGDTGGERAGDDGFAVGFKAAVGEVGTDVDEVHGVSCAGALCRGGWWSLCGGGEGAEEGAQRVVDPGAEGEGPKRGGGEGVPVGVDALEVGEERRGGEAVEGGGGDGEAVEGEVGEDVGLL